MALNQLHTLLTNHEEWLMERILAYAKKQGYTRYTSTLVEPWRMSVSGLTKAIGKGLENSESLRAGLTPDDCYKDDPVSEFAIMESRLHRQRGVNLSMFLGLLKYYRASYFDLVEEKAPPELRASFHGFLLDFFDRLEVALSGDWAATTDDPPEVQAINRQLANEKNMFLTLVASLPNPVFLYDRQRTLSFYNSEAAKLIGLACDAGSGYYHERFNSEPACFDAQTQAAHLLPWIEDRVHEVSTGKNTGTHFEEEAHISGLDMHFSVSVARMSDVSGKFDGVIVTLEDITRLKKAENALKESEAKSRALFDSAADSQFLIDFDGRFIDVNRAAAMELGYSREMLLNMGLEDIVPEEVKKRIPGFLSRITANGSASFETMHVRSTGEFYPVDVNAGVIGTADGEAILATARDMTERKINEEALRKSEEKFRRIFESMEDGYFLTSLDGTIMLVNPAAARQLGYEVTQLIGLSVTERVYRDPEDRREVISILQDKGSVTGYRVDFKRSDGGFIKAEINLHFVYNEAGHPVALEGIFRDATDRIRAEEILKEREQQYRGFFMNNHAVMVLSDPKSGDIVDANPAAERFYGYDRDELLQMNMSDIQAMEEQEIFREMAMAQQEHRNHFLLKHRVFGGQVRDVEVYSGPVMVNERALLYSVIHDVTERRRLETELQRLATTDSLTGALNRHEFMRRAQEEMARARRYGHPLTVLMLDLDHFKRINDTYGHSVGDDALRILTDACRECLRETDLFGRLGGEEFSAVLTETEAWAAEKAADRLRQAMAQATIDTGRGTTTITASIGLSAMTAADGSIDDILSRADKALYVAKDKGRNRVERL
ncbi:PAS domain S-box protein [Salidesulfovibrio onnuriiensis]|uniref:PAS domain S-box protein n=1 Tax=Salidesulfovibrio onnuriiensis TaxID=2583823 RepID=UPI0011C79A30|nr:PAS domain S-box protein [Salidesulfovibrio onnuriiensis]